MKKQMDNPKDNDNETIELPSEKRKVREMIEWEVKHRGMINVKYHSPGDVTGNCIPITYLNAEESPERITAQPQDPYENLTEDE